jgi:hypothetical protein
LFPGVQRLFFNFKKLTLLSLVVGQIADAGLHDYGLIVKTDNDSAGADQLVVLKYPDTKLPFQRLGEVLICGQTAINGHDGSPLNMISIIIKAKVWNRQERRVERIWFSGLLFRS